MDLPARSFVRPAAAPRVAGVAALLVLVLLPAAARAQTPAAGGAAPPAPVPPEAAAAAQPRPVVDAITCHASCRGVARAVPGSVIRVSGEAMGNVTSIILLGRRGSRDDVTVPATPVTPTAVEAAVPPNARGGRVRAIAAFGRRSLSSRARVVIRPPGSADPGGPLVRPRRRPASCSFRAAAPRR